MLKFSKAISREQPIYSTKAHVFQIDPKTRRNWIPVCPQPISVSYYFDSNRDTYRIISVDGAKAVINSTITPNMNFTKTSQKFGQWSDAKANTIYGLGFQSELEITKFMEKFSEVRDLSRQIKTKADTGNDTDGKLPSSIENNDNGLVTSTKNLENDDDTHVIRASSPSGVAPSSVTYSQLKYENEQLKSALAQSSANAKKWEVELQTLKTNNSKLSSALEESSGNVEEWKELLASYKEEGDTLRSKLSQLEAERRSPDETSQYQKRVAELSDRVQLQEREIKRKNQEMEELRNKIERLTPSEAQNQKLQERIKTLEKENSDVKESLAALRLELSEVNTQHQLAKNDLLKLQRQLGTKIQDLQVLQDQITKKMQS